MTATMVLKMERGQQVKAEIEKYLKSQEIKRCFIVGAIGSVMDVRLSVPIDAQFPPTVERYAFEGPGEVVSFIGEIMEKSEMDPALRNVYGADPSDYFIHIHASVAFEDAVVRGGGFVDAKVFRGLTLLFQTEALA